MDVVIYPAEVLRQKATAIEEIDESITQKANEMLEIMCEYNGVGLAAPQVGWPKRLIVMNVTGEKDGEMVFINPSIVNQEGTVISEEGCLSFPGITGNVPRSETVEVIAYNLKGEKLKIEADGLMARAFQHEIDHLNGVLFIDKMTPASSMANAKKVKEFERKYG